MAKNIAKAVQKGVSGLSGAVDDLYRLGDAGQDALRSIPRDLNATEAANAMRTAAQDIRASRRHLDTTPNYAVGKGRTDVIREARTSSSNLPVPISDIEAGNRQFSDMMSQAAYNAGGPQAAPKSTTYRNAGAGERYTAPWDEQVRRSQQSGGTGMRSGSTDLVVYTSPQQQRQQAMDSMADSIMRRQALNDANKTGWQHFVDGVSDKWARSGFNARTTANRRAYNEFIFSKGGSDFVKSNRAFGNMQAGLGIHGTYRGNAEGFDALNRAQSRAQAAAEEAARVAGENASGIINWDGIGEWAKENQLLVAGGLVAGTLLLTDD